MFERNCRALAHEIQRRRASRGFTPGGWYGDEHLLLATPRSLLVVRPWGERAGCEWLAAPRLGEPWRPARPEVNLGAREVAERPRGERELLQRGPVPARPRRRQRDTRQLVLPLLAVDGAPLAAERRRAVVRFFEAIPERPLRHASEVDPEYQWPVLQLLNQGGEGALELFESTPALLVLLIFAPALAPRTLFPPVAELVQWRQRRLLEQLGFPGSRQALRLLRKVPASELDLGSALSLQRLCRDEQTLARLSHLPRVTRALLSVARSPERFARLEREVQLVLLDPDPVRGRRLAERLEELLVRVEQARRNGFAAPIRLRSARQVRRVRGELAGLRDDVRSASAFDSLPPPPFPGIPGEIEPLRSVGDLDREGRELRNCVRGYRDRAMSGHYAIYRVLRPGRATLSMVRHRKGWQVSELKGPGNAEVGPETARAVEDWLSRWAAAGEASR